MRRSALSLLSMIPAILTASLAQGATISGGSLSGGSAGPIEGYVWSLEALAADASRFEMTWETGAWADAVDTEAELLALGWSSTTITGDCAQTNDSADEATIASQIAAACDPGGATPRDCEERILRFQDDCDYDVTAGSGNSDSPSPIDFGYSNAAFIGGGMDSTRINCTDDFPDNTFSTAHCIMNQNDPINAYNHPVVGSAFTWKAGTSGLGAGSDTASNAVVALASDCSNFEPGERAVLIGSDGVGNVYHVSQVAASAVDGSDCNIQLVTPLYGPLTAGAGLGTIQQQQSPTTRNTYVMDMQIGFNRAPDGATSNGAYGANAIRILKSDRFLVTRTRLGPLGKGALDSRGGNTQLVVRQNVVGPCQHCKRRGNNGGLFGGNTAGGAVVILDNAFIGAAKRFAGISTESSWGSWYAFNWQDDFLATAPLETGNHCDGVGNMQGFPEVSDPNDERNVFIGHASLGDRRIGGWLVEGNDLNCKSQYDNDTGTTSRNGTYFRNRSNRTMGNFIFATGGRLNYGQNFIANRYKTWTGPSTVDPDIFGKWNVAQTTMMTVSSSGAVWPTVGAGRNIVDATGEHDDYPILLPPSLAKRDGTPSWWCVESGPWNASWNFGAGDGYGGVTYDLPAKRRYLGQACTRPPEAPLP